jgi:trans-aconitate methyltransferase
LTLDGALYRAPIKNVQNVLDVGTGTGIWAIEFAEENPSATVLGTDLSPIQPTEVPPNCSFLIDDCDNDWVFREHFDFVHTRAMVAAIKDWPRFFEQAYANLKPGGYLECQEITFPPFATDPSLTHENSPLLRWSHLFGEAAAKIGLDHQGPRKFAPMLREAGFVEIHAKQYNWPVGRWAKGQKNKLLGRFVMEDLLDWLPSSALALFTRVLKWSREEVELFLASVRKELKDKNKHFYAHVIIWWARKPEDASALGSAAEPIMNDEGALESDEDKPTKAKESTAAPEAVASPGALADEAADLTLASPKPTTESTAGPSTSAEATVSPSEESITIPSIESAKQHAAPTLEQGPKSTDAFADSILTLASQADAATTAESSSTSAAPVHTSTSQEPLPASSSAMETQGSSTGPTEVVGASDPAPAAPRLQDFASALGPTSLRPDASSTAPLPVDTPSDPPIVAPESDNKGFKSQE